MRRSREYKLYIKNFELIPEEQTFYNWLSGSAYDVPQAETDIITAVIGGIIKSLGIFTLDTDDIWYVKIYAAISSEDSNILEVYIDVNPFIEMVQIGMINYRTLSDSKEKADKMISDYVKDFMKKQYKVAVQYGLIPE